MLKILASRTGVLASLRRAWKHDQRAGMEPLKSEIAALTRELSALRTLVTGLDTRAKRSDRRVAQLRSILLLNERQQTLVASLPRLLDAAQIRTHVANAIDRAPLHQDPFPHIVVDDVLPDRVYRLLVKGIPPAVFFGDRDPVKQNLRIPFDDGPMLASRVWHFVDAVVARDAIRPAVLKKLHEPLRAHYAEIFGAAYAARAEALPQAVSGGRVMLRRPGYHLAPHRDPKRSMVTCLLYLAGRTEGENFGTEIYRVVGDRESPYSQTFYPEEEGARCELVKVVPNRPNTMLVFLNSHGAHGARIPTDVPASVERYAYQFYLGPGDDALAALLADLPADRRAMWKTKASPP